MVNPVPYIFMTDQTTDNWTVTTSSSYSPGGTEEYFGWKAFSDDYIWENPPGNFLQNGWLSSLNSYQSGTGNPLNLPPLGEYIDITSSVLNFNIKTLQIYKGYLATTGT